MCLVRVTIQKFNINVSGKTANFRPDFVLEKFRPKTALTLQVLRVNGL